MEGHGQPDLRDDGTPKEKIHEKEVVDEQDAVTQKPTSLNIIDGEIAKEELQEKEVSDEQDAITQEPASLNTTDLRDGENLQEKLQEKEASDEQDAATQELASLNILVKISTNPRKKEPKDEVIPDFMDEDFIVTLESSHDIEIIEVEPQQQDNDEVKQDAIT